MEDLIRLLIEPHVTDVDKIKIERKQEDNQVFFTVYVPKDDIAKVIGKEGKMIKAIKNLLKIRAIKENLFAAIDLKEV